MTLFDFGVRRASLRGGTGKLWRAGHTVISSESLQRRRLGENNTWLLY